MLQLPTSMSNCCTLCRHSCKHSKTVQPDTRVTDHGIEVDTNMMQYRRPRQTSMQLIIQYGTGCYSHNEARRERTPVSRFECVSGLSVYPVEIRSVNNLSSSEDCSTDYCQPV